MYKVSKLKRFFTLVNVQMQDELRFVLIDNIEAYAAFMETACEGEVVVVSPTEVTVTYPDNPSLKRRRAPLFAVDLVVSGAYAKSGFRKMIFGSSATRLLEEAKVPLFLYH